MEIQLSKPALKAATQNWNKLTNIKNKSKNYFIPNSIEEYEKFDKYAARIIIDSWNWILLEIAKTAFNEIVNRLYEAPELKGVVSYETIYVALKKELEIEIYAIKKDPNNKREFLNVLEKIQHSIENKVSTFDFFFVIQGLELEKIEKISCGKVEIFIFNQELRDQLISASFSKHDSQNPENLSNTQDFFDKNFLNRVCIKSTSYGDFNIVRKKSYRQARQLINYFRYILCLFIHDRVSEQMIKINILSEVYSNSEKTLIRREKDNTIILSWGRGRKPLQTFPID